MSWLLAWLAVVHVFIIMLFAEGLTYAVLSAVCNGSSCTGVKFDAARTHGVTPHLLNFFAGLGASASGLIFAALMRSNVRSGAQVCMHRLCQAHLSSSM